MKPTSCEASLYRIPCRRVLQNSAEKFSSYEYVIVRVGFSDGIEGVGWTYTQGKGGTAILHLLNDYFSKVILSNGISDPKQLYDSIYSATYSYGLEGVARLAYSAVDVAFWDALAKSRELPLYLLLGGSKGNTVRAYRSAIDLNITDEEAISDIRRYKERGFGSFKIKVGRADFDEDLRRIETVKGVIGSDDVLMVDANRRWSVSEGVAKGRELERRGIFWLEEPIEAELFDGYCLLKNELNMKVAAGESLYNRSDATRLISGSCVDVIQLDILRIGGITEWMKFAQMAEVLGLPMAPHFSEEISVQALCAIRNGMFLEHLPGSNLHDSGFLLRSYSLKDGFGTPPNGAGHGIVFDFEKLEEVRQADS